MNIRTLARSLATVSLAALIAGPALSQTVFVPEGSANTVRMVDAATGETIRRVQGLEAVHGLAGAPGVPVLVAGSYAEIDREEVMETAQPAGMEEDEHAAHHAAPQQAMGPSDAGLSLLSVLDAETGEILRRVEVPGAVHHTAVSPDGRYAVATHPSGDGISVVDLESYELVAWVPTGAMPNYAVFGEDPGTVYVSNAGNGTISEVDLGRGIVRRNLIAGEGPEHMALDAATGRLYVADAGPGVVYELALDSGETLRSFDIGGEIHGIDLTEDGARAIVAGRGEDKLAAIDLAEGEVTTVALAPQPYHLTTVPGTGRIFVSSRQDPLVWIVDPDTLTVTGEFAVDGEGHQMVAIN